MVNLLYSVASITCALICIILPAKIKKILRVGTETEKSFLMLISWTAAFCLADGLWGITAGELVMNRTLLFIMSCVFHSSAALTPAIWLSFVITYLGNVKRVKVYKYITLTIILIELLLIIINAFNGMMFYVNADGIYCSTPVRKLLFYLQYVTYVFIGIISVAHLVSSRKESNNALEHNYQAVLLFVASPIFCGIFQMLYPDAPAYSIGYTLGVCVIYSFILTDIINQKNIENARAEAANQSKTEFLFNMSHDIRTPMNAILGYTDIGLRHSSNPEQAKANFKKIKVAGGHLLNLINDILEMSRIESGKFELVNAPVDMRRAINGVVQMNEPLATAKSIIFTAEADEIENPYVYADELHINEVIINLLSNAVKYTPAGGKVKYTVCQLGKVDSGVATYRFEVADNGIGMSLEFQTHLFETFSREESAGVSKIEGAGLGLSIVKRIVDMAGGTIQVNSKPGEGSTFIVELPFRVLTEEEITAFEEENTGSAEIPAEDKFKGKRILLVEDNEMNREIATDILTEAGFVVEEAEDGEIAVETVAEKGIEYYDFILMDIQMPVMNGYEATREIRSLQDGNRIPIIALSANAFDEDRRDSLNAGMNEHVAKPINVKNLFSTLGKFI